MESKTGLMPCPFCGKAPRINESNKTFMIECSNDFCFIQPSTLSYITLDEAIEAWNERA